MEAGAEVQELRGQLEDLRRQVRTSDVANALPKTIDVQIACCWCLFRHVIPVHMHALQRSLQTSSKLSSKQTVA